MKTYRAGAAFVDITNEADVPNVVSRHNFASINQAKLANRVTKHPVWKSVKLPSNASHCTFSIERR